MVKNGRGIKALRDLLFPPRCVACGKLLPWQIPTEDGAGRDVLCESCRKLWESEKLESCGVCAKKVTECNCTPLALQKVKCVGFAKLVYYDPNKTTSVQSKLLYRIKKQRNDSAERFLAAELCTLAERLLLEENITRESTVISYLPRSHAARLEFGTDQAEVLARRISQISGIPFRPLIRRRFLQNAKQKNLSYAKRFQNAKRSFWIPKDADCRGLTVILVDDMVTTGAGMARATQLLRRARAQAVYCLTVASDSVNKDQIR